MVPPATHSECTGNDKVRRTRREVGSGALAPLLQR